MSNDLDNRIKEHIDRQFADVGPSQQLFDLKEELYTNLKERIKDYREKGMEEDQAFTEAVVSLGDLSGLVEDMRRHGQQQTKQNVYSSMSNRLSNGGIITGVILILFGLLTCSMLYFMNQPLNAVVGTSIFIVAGGALLHYSILIRETQKRYGMNQIRAVFYAIATGLFLFSFFVLATTYAATKQFGIAISSLLFFCLVSVGLYLYLWLTETDRKKDSIK